MEVCSYRGEERIINFVGGDEGLVVLGKALLRGFFEILIEG